METSEEAELRSPAEVAVVQAADFGELQDLSHRGRLDGPEVGGVLVEREMSTRPMVVAEVASQDVMEMSLTEHEHVVQAFTPDRADESLGERVLPRALRCRQDFTDTQALQALPEHMTVDRVAIAEEIGRGGVVWEGVHDLLGHPGAGGMLGDIEVEDASAVVSEHDEDEQHAQARCGNREEIDGDEVPDGT